VIPEAEEEETPPSPVLSEPPTISPRMMRFARKLRASILSGREGRHIKVIAGVACSPEEGCTTSMLMLAAACAEVGERVLLVDLDFWNSQISKGHSPVGPVGGSSTKSKAARHVAANSEWGHLALDPAEQRSETQGAPFSVEELVARLDQLRESYDRILLDTAPLLQHMDAASLTGGCDAVLVFSRWKTTTRREVKSMLKLLADVGVHPTAIVATRVMTSQLKEFGEASLYFPVEEKPEAA
jgi:Mrp family chromosome partitioning ATPase